jgi:c-di-GMP-binding flagellar brake protein YcgR
LSVDQNQIFLAEPDSQVIDPRDPIQEVFIAFSKNHGTFSFAAKYLGKNSCPLKEGNEIPCLAVSLPEYVEETDRRNIRRFYVEDISQIPLSFCPEGDPSVKYSGYLHNIGMDGIGISIAFAGDIGLHNNQKCDISILSSWGQEVMSIPARYRYCKEMSNQEMAILGFQFTASNKTIDGSKKLAAISQLISHLQAARRRTLSFA